MRKIRSSSYLKRILGWREWVALPELGIARIKAKIDTGARTSALHAFSLEIYKEKRKRRARFLIHPIQKDTKTVVQCEADIVDERYVMDSGGHKELRYVIRTEILIGHQAWAIEITLTNRDTMGFRMLLGRSAIKEHFYIDPDRSFLTKKKR